MAGGEQLRDPRTVPQSDIGASAGRCAHANAGDSRFGDQQTSTDTPWFFEAESVQSNPSQHTTDVDAQKPLDMKVGS